MSKPAIIPDTTAAGIAVDPRTLERVIPESRRPDGSLRKEIKIRPGFTPQEDVRRFRGTRQTQMDANQLPKGHIIGWTPPAQTAAASTKAGLSKSAKKNEKRKEKRKDKKEGGAPEKVRDNWDDDDDGEGGEEGVVDGKASATTSPKREGVHTADQPNWAVAPETKKDSTKKGDVAAGELADKLGKLEVR